MAIAPRMYARALLEAAQGHDRLERVREDLGDLVAAVREVPELREILRNPELDRTTRAELLSAVLEGADELVRNFVLLVSEKGRARELEQIYRELEELAAAAENVLEVELTTAYELSDDEAAEILRQIEDSSGRSVAAQRTVNPELIGGIVLRVGSLRMDSSVRGRLERLRRELVSGR